MEAVLSVNNLTTHFFTEDGVIKAVDGVSFELQKGETLGIAGESGSGKTVTSLSILKLIPSPPGKIVCGEVYFKDRNLLALSNREIRNIRGCSISMIFQDPMTSLNPVFTVGNQITEALVLHQKLSKSEARVKAMGLLDDVGIPNPEKRILQFPHEYSGGMRQRAMIAMALACRPEILIADEPTTALDVTIQAQILKLISKIKSGSGSSVIFITHDLGVIAQIADNVMIMYSGKVVEYGDVETIFYNACHPYTLGLLGSIPKIDENRETLVPIKGNPPSLLHLPEGCNFNPRCNYAKDVCFKVKPELKNVHRNHKSACHLRVSEIKKS